MTELADLEASQQSQDTIVTPTSAQTTTSVENVPVLNSSNLETNMEPTQSYIEVAVNPVALITNECITITSAMRKNARWAQSSVAAILGGGIVDTAASGGSLSVPGSANGSPKPGGLARRRGGGRASMEIRGRSEDSIRGEDVAFLDNEMGLAGRWGLRGKKGKSIQDNPLIAAFAKLRADLTNCHDVRNFDTPALLHPFLQVIRSSSTSGPITSLALIAITKFFSYNIITRSSKRLSVAMQLLSSAITHCRFEASDSAQDEVVLLRILKLMEGMMSGPGGELLGDESVCEMMETGLSMCCQMRLSEVLRRSAEMSMVVMCQVVFERLKHLEVEAEDAEGEFVIETITKDLEKVEITPSVNGELDNPVASTMPSTLDEKPAVEPVVASTEVEPVDDQQVEIRPYSLPSIRELLRVLVSLLDPHNKQHTDTMRVMALRIIDVAFEVAGPSITKHPSLAGLAHDDLCRYLFQLVRSETMSILQESLRVTGTLLATSRSGLKLQQELFMSYVVTCLHPRVEIPREQGIDPELYDGVPEGPKSSKVPVASGTESGRATPVPMKERQKLGLEGGARRPDAREAMVECVGALARIPSFMVELYVNYDCDVDRSDLCEDVIGFLSRNAFPDSATWSTTNVPPLCLDALLGFIQFIADRLDQEPRYQDFPDPKVIQANRDKKQVVIQGTTKFNESPKKGIAFLVQAGIISDVDDVVSIAKFLKSTSRVSKKQLGEYLTKKGNDKVLDAFLATFDFNGLRVDEALREMLETFRLPGEAALISTLLEAFSAKYHETANRPEVANPDAVYVLSYAIIMLNVDQHNPNLKTRMMYADFAKNLRGVNDNKEFQPDYLEAIFESIKTREIIMPEEHDNQFAFDYAWKELLMKAHGAGELTICDTNIFDANMFAATWKPLVATLSYVFMSATDDAVFSRIITGFDQCARIAASYGLQDCLDRIIRSLSLISTLGSETPPSTSLNTEVQVNGNSVMVSEMAVRFGRDFKAQLATVVLFRIVTGKEAVIGSSWHQIIRIWLNLFVNSLIPPYFLVPDQNALDLPPIPLRNPTVVIERHTVSRDVGLFSTLSSYLTSYAADDPPEPSDEELESTLCTIDCVNSCFLGDIFANISHLSTESLDRLIKSLLSQLPEASSPVVIIKHEQAPASVNQITPDKNDQTYDPAVLYVTELATCLVLKNRETIAKFGAELTEALQDILRDVKNAHPIVVSRTVYYLLTLLKVSHEHEYMRIPLLLHDIATLDKAIVDTCAEPIVKGVAGCLRSSSSLKKEMVNSPDFWVLLRMLSSNEEIALLVFDTLESIATDDPTNVTADNYVSVVTLLNDFATVGSVGAVFEQAQDKIAKRGKAAKLTNRPDAEVVTRGSKAVLDIYSLTIRVPALISHSHLEQTEAWTTYWSPIFQALSTQCTNPCREIRNNSFSCLQRSLLSPQLASNDHTEWTAIFGDVLFPLITTLLKPEVYQSDPRGMSETRVQAATLLCKIFLHYLVLLSEWDGMLDLWLRILDIMDRLMNSGQRDHLEEAVPESLKNILLVMASGELLVEPGKQEPGNQKQEDLWTQTWKRLERFLPGLYADLYPDVPPISVINQPFVNAKSTTQPTVSARAPSSTPPTTTSSSERTATTLATTDPAPTT